jgi:hypothetical protein
MQGQCCKRNLERTDVQEEASGATRRQQWNKGLRLESKRTSSRIFRKALMLKIMK